jgi:predicted Rossmann-fold nucleotide-binding protein
MDELFEALTLIQTRKIGKFPIVLVGKKYWGGLFQWVKEVLGEEEMVDQNDMELFHIAETADEAVQTINEFYSKYLLKPNF